MILSIVFKVTGRQIQSHAGHFSFIQLRHANLFSELLTISFVSTVMLKFNVQVQRNVGTVYFVAFIVRTLKLLFDLDGKSSIFLPIFEFIKPEVLLLSVLHKQSITSISLTSSCSSVVRSDNSLIRAKLNQFFKYVFQNYSLQLTSLRKSGNTSC